MNYTIIDKQGFVDCEDIKENTAIHNFNSNELKLGKVNISKKQIEKISFLLAHDLKAFAETNGNFSNLSANAVYSHLQNNQFKKRKKINLPPFV